MENQFLVLWADRLSVAGFIVLPVWSLWSLVLALFVGHGSPVFPRHDRTREFFREAFILGLCLSVLWVAFYGLHGSVFKLLALSGSACLLFFSGRLRKGTALRPGGQSLDAVRRVLVVGTGAQAKKLTESLRQNADTEQEAVRILGYLDMGDDVERRFVPNTQVLGSIGEISSILRDNVVDEVILAVPCSLLPRVETVARVCEEEGVNLRLMADFFDVRVARTSVVACGQIPLLTLEPVAQAKWKLFGKRALDIVAVSCVLPLLLPLFGLIALAIKLDSPGPVFFSQERVGFRKRRFAMLKFRSMVPNAEQLQKQLEHLNEAEGPIFKIADDPRITRVGKFLRRTSLDELPQLLHVLTGEMSLVGPRPMSVRDVELFDKGAQRKRFSVKPGLTCLWQISGRSALPFSMWLKLDIDYIENWSLWLDLKILFKTIPVVLARKGAC
jgi:exopolysaccharide biosynthesis polyprenyl glycosylphosphotransferase